jgi:hypothetical protein
VSSIVFVVVFAVMFVILVVTASSNMFVFSLTGVTIQYVSEVTIRNIAIPISCKRCSFLIFFYLLRSVDKYFGCIHQFLPANLSFLRASGTRSESFQYKK